MSFPKEYRQILDLLAAGKINAEEAQRLMEKLGRGPEVAEADGSAGSSGAAGAVAVVSAPSRAGSGEETRRNPKYFRIHVDSHDGDEINIRIPLQIVRAGLKLTAVLPEDAREKIKESGIDLSNLSELQGEELIEALRELSIDVDSSDGDVIRIFCE